GWLFCTAACFPIRSAASAIKVHRPCGHGTGSLSSSCCKVRPSPLSRAGPSFQLFSVRSYGLLFIVFLSPDVAVIAEQRIMQCLLPEIDPFAQDPLYGTVM